MRTWRMLLARMLLLCCAAMLLSGCFLRALFGRVDPRDQPGDLIVTLFHGEFSTATCTRVENSGYYECTYWLVGEEIDVTSTAQLLSEFGFFGVLVDPVILQVPADTTSVVATYDVRDGAGAQQAVVQIVNSFEVEPGESVLPESGHKFAILEFPDHVVADIPEGDPHVGTRFDVDVRLERPRAPGASIEPLPLKAMLTGKVVVRGHSYYIPLLPCVRDFASVPSITIPVSETGVSLIPDLQAHWSRDLRCFGETYDFSNAPPPEQTIHLPLILR
jgi:hypothetical protein